MALTQPNQTSPLLPDRHPQSDLFVCDLSDAVLKSDFHSMEIPLFSLSTKKDLTPFKYANGNDYLEIAPGLDGRPTQFDKDVLIFAISQLMEAKNQGQPISQTIVCSARSMLIFANRTTDGKSYEALSNALSRLVGVKITTNRQTGGEEQLDIFGMIDSAHLRRNHQTGRVIEMRIKLSDWLYRAVQGDEVLTLSRDYFRLRKPLERRIYELARKHCGHQKRWAIGLELLHKKTGSSSPLKKFRFQLKALVETNHLPDYETAYDDTRDMVTFINRSGKKPKALSAPIHLSPETYEQAKKVAPTWDVYQLEYEWKEWIAQSDKPAPNKPDKAFVGFCRNWYKQRGDA